MILSSRHGDDAPPSQGLDLLGLFVGCKVAVAQAVAAILGAGIPVLLSASAAPRNAIGGDGEGVVSPGRYGDDFLTVNKSLRILSG